VASALGLKRDEISFFKRLVVFNQAKSSDDRDRAFQELLKVKRFQRVRQIEAEDYENFSKGYTIAVYLALSRGWSKKTSSQMAEAFGTSKSEIEEALERLKSLGLLEKREEGWRTKEYIIEPPAQMSSANVRNSHRLMLKKGIESLDTQTSDRDVGSLTLALSKAGYEDLKRRLVQLRKEMALFYSEEKEPKKIYQLSYVLFSLADL
jgi:uncharacterized protein (TIGR02147 family)